MSDEDKTPADYWRPPNAFQRGLARVQKAWSNVWRDTQLVNGKRSITRVEFTLWAPALALATPIVFVMGLYDPAAVPLLLACPSCHAPHIDRDVWRFRLHKTHRCEACGIDWTPTDYPTVGV